VAIASIAVGAAIAVASVISFFVLNLSNMPLQWDQLMVAGLVIALIPPAVVEFLDLRWQREIDKNIPRLLREIAESSMTGLTLARAIEVSAERDYGPLTSELKRVITQMSLGSSFEDAMKSLGARCRTKLAQRTATLITEVSRSGGDTKDIMEQLNNQRASDD
jgi:flagellar protein FlaJ